MVSVADSHFGAIEDALRARGVWNETLMVFSSDNGGTPDLIYGDATQFLPICGTDILSHQLQPLSHLLQTPHSTSTLTHSPSRVPSIHPLYLQFDSQPHSPLSRKSKQSSLSTTFSNFRLPLL